MARIEKRCCTCRYAIGELERNEFGRKILRQHCTNAAYNSPAYTAEQLLEDWALGCCRFWTPKITDERKGQK